MKGHAPPNTYIHGYSRREADLLLDQADTLAVTNPEISLFKGNGVKQEP